MLLLHALRIEYLAARLGGLDAPLALWDDQLSGGEAQRVVLARLLAANARLALLDEATSALDPDTERDVFEVLAHSGAALVTVSHSPDLLRHHNTLAELDHTQRLRVTTVHD
mmetsp:Transcript_17817/g.43848  ORF Transcript_17817/g.43848 Transcript_17817/m.43848 type:complete len:112 (-) Transcript_17817:84-419(-)